MEIRIHCLHLNEDACMDYEIDAGPSRIGDLDTGDQLVLRGFKVKGAKYGFQDKFVPVCTASLAYLAIEDVLPRTALRVLMYFLGSMSKTNQIRETGTQVAKKLGITQPMFSAELKILLGNNLVAKVSKGLVVNPVLGWGAGARTHQRAIDLYLSGDVGDLERISMLGDE